MAKTTRRGGLGTFAGVFTPSILTILGIILFLRLSYVVGNAGLIAALVIIIGANLISVLTSFSLAAIATHLRVKAGGDYYLISRTLGLGFGGAIGIVLFAAQAISVGFYCIGFAEAATDLMGFHHPAAVRAIAATVLILLMGLAWMGSDWATRFQYVVMALITIALVAFTIGGLGNWHLEVLRANMGAHAESPPFWTLFAVFFPAVTGFTQGVSMSGELRDPGRSIPTGTFSAVALSFIIYVGAVVLFAGALPGDLLATDYGAMKTAATWSPLIDAGIFAATLSSALASFMGAPRILQSVARDRIFPVLLPFAQGVGATSNPRRAVALTAVVGLFIVALGDLNAIAAIVSMFFLVSYGLLNYATYYEARARSPSFRPRFKLYHERISLAGAIACLAAMLAIDPAAGVIAAAVVGGIYYYLRARGVPARWADSRRSFHLQQAREHMLAAARETVHARDWRPQIMVFSDNAERRRRLVDFAAWIGGGSGLITVVKVIASARSDVVDTRRKELEALQKELKTYEEQTFPLVVAASGLEDGIAVTIQAAGVGPVGVNTVLANMSTEGGYFSRLGIGRYSQNLRAALRLGCNLLILDATNEEWASLEATKPSERTIDIWWTEGETSALMLIFAHLMTRAEMWEDAEIRVLVAGDEAGGRCQRARETLAASNIDAKAVAVGRFTRETITETSWDAAIVFLPLTMPVDEPFRVAGLSPESILSSLPITVLAVAADDIELAADPDQGTASDISQATDDLADAAGALKALARRSRKLERQLNDIQTQRPEALKAGEEAVRDLDAREKETREALSEVIRQRQAALTKLSAAEAKMQALDGGRDKPDAAS